MCCPCGEFIFEGLFCSVVFKWMQAYLCIRVFRPYLFNWYVSREVASGIGGAKCFEGRRTRFLRSLQVQSETEERERFLGSELISELESALCLEKVLFQVETARS